MNSADYKKPPDESHQVVFVILFGRGTAVPRGYNMVP